MDPRIAEAYGNRGIICAQEGNPAQAISDFTKAVEIDPQNADVYNNRAIFYFKLKKYDKARADFHKAEELGAVVDPGFINDLKKASGLE
jgi:Flp pilus assembly protein TadD